MNDDDTRRALDLLTEVERALAGIRCQATTDCCRFAVTGREPWLTAVEWRLLVAELRRQGRRLPEPNDDEDGRCPFLDARGRCQVYAARPLGCRTFFCERATPPAPHASEFRAAARALAELSEGGGAVGDDGKSRPITSWLAAERRPTPSARGRARARGRAGR
ncbi:MAG: YkgJ family cysteine cluster protein [Deltaproteobacteria bacterium]|nr:YkgJ family cysteine cluster protein [Deltaproteobacteria bacterium]